MSDEAVVLAPEVEAFVRDARLGRFATVDEQGMPFLQAFCYVWLEGAFYSALDAKPKRVPVEKLKRVRNLIERPNVGVIIDRWSEDWSELAYVQFRGKALLLREGEERDRALAALHAKYRQYDVMPIEENPTIKITPTGVTVWGRPFWD